MSTIVIFGAGGRAGRCAVTEALSRGHRVTAVVREPANHAALAATGVTVVAGDVRDPGDVAAAASGHDAAVSAVYDAAEPPGEFYVRAAQALLRGLPAAGVSRLLVVGISVTMETTPGRRIMDAPDFPPEFMEFCLGHAAGLNTLRTARTTLDWLSVNPAGDFDHAGMRTGGYRVVGERVDPEWDGPRLISYDDFAVALIDEIETPAHHRTQLAFDGRSQHTSEID